MTNKTRIRLLAASALLAFGTAFAVAQGTGPAQTPNAVDAQEGASLIKAQFGGRGHGRHGGMHGGMFGGRAAMLDLMREVDANGDNALTQDEIDAFRAAEVEGADDNDDDALSLDEFETVFRERTRPLMVDAFQALDEDGDGSITTAELDERFGSVVERFDRNDDGQLDRDDRGGRDGRRARGR